MRILDFAYYALALVPISLAACTAPQIPMNIPGANSEHVSRQRLSSSNNILYVAGSNYVAMFSYPALSPIGTISPGYTLGIGCADNPTGFIYFTANPNSGSPRLDQYVIGGTTKVGGIQPAKRSTIVGCAADPTTGNLAVLYTNSNSSYVRVFRPGSKKGTKYSQTLVNTLYSSTYDGAGNLFVEGWTGSGATSLIELPASSSQFIGISVAGLEQGQLQWDGTDICARVAADHQRGISPTIQRIQISGSSGEIIGTTTLKRGYRGTWIQGGTALSGEFGSHKSQNVLFYNYPAGGRPYQTFGPVGETVEEMIVTGPSSGD
ncbi:MAG: hypothetical protein JOZ77_08190 [Candidatus Eremiobacteraeota bacterium]|nr:hypothetical protein [Candidatus Eremiobacteraeota bacterium]